MPRAPLRAAIAIGVLGLAGYLCMASLADWSAFTRAGHALADGTWLLVLGLSLLSYGARFLRWHRFVHALGHRLPALRHLGIYLSGFALTLTPGKAGETIRSYYLHPHGVSYAESLGSFVAERLLDVMVVSLFAALIVLYLPEHRALVGAALTGGLLLLALFHSRLFQQLSQRLARRTGGRHAAQGLDSLRHLLSGRRLALALPPTLLAWAAQGLGLALIVQALGHALPLPQLLAIYCLSILAGALSFIPGGLGATEAAMALLLVAAGLPQADAIAAALIARGLTLWPAIALGMLATWPTMLHRARH